MSKARAIILAVEIEGLTQSEVAARYEVSKGWVSKLMARYRAEGEAAFEPRSRRPRTSPTRVADVLNERIVNLRVELVSRGLDAGPATIHWHLAKEGHTVSVSTIRRRLVDAGLIAPEPKKRPKSSYIRFEADLPNETWQSDFTHYRLTTGADTEILVWLDDHSRYALSVTAHDRVTGDDVVDTFNQTASEQGFPASVLTDNGKLPAGQPSTTTRFAGYRGGRNALETRLVELRIEQKHSRPNHPDRATPAVAYTRLPKTGPAGSTAGPHYRIRHDRIDKTGAVSLRRAGRMHHIGIGRAHKHTPVILLIDDLNIRVIATDTGELLRHLTLNPDIGYQPRFKN